MDIIGHPGYTIYENGRVWSKRTRRFLKTFSANGGYVYIDLGRNHRYSLHRLVATHYIPNPDNKPCVDHIDRNNTNNASTNLRWVTPTENNLNRQTDELNNIKHNGYSFVVRIKRHYVKHNIGSYATIEEARAARDEWIATH